MNNKGFTLIELLAVILILSLLALLANTSVTKVVRDSKTDLYDSQMQIIKLAAESWGSENIDKLPDNGQCKYITLGDLKNYGLLDTSVKNPKTDKEFSNDMNIKIVATENKYGKTNISYEVDSDNINECEIAVEKTLDRICTYDKTSTVAAQTAGAKYSCEVKPGTSYNFYVLTTPADGAETINLIMDQNINSDGTPAGMTGTTKSGENIYNLVAWNNESGQSTNAYGPVTAMQFLYNATKDWTNIDPVNYTYNDKTTQGTTAENTSYTSFISNNGVATITPLTGDGVTIGSEATPLRARMPIYAGDASITEVSSKTDTNAYLYDNLDSSGSAAPYGYWTLSSIAGNSFYAYYVLYNGSVHAIGVGSDGSRGVRAVINLKI